ncbi:glycosyl hydrolase family 7 [Colletotrichum lupini]|uniref:Glucanase n=1 Tax=Colletotrichum lupini TaxID=145971 RepID=A0A9Q8SQ69_9PEZI|nr:glycosyl hydrolase family 7 [Colletotrichum lupini]UQC81524.1 glycosyl hydrolase family 7 [Colletotrichum lupini]
MLSLSVLLAVISAVSAHCTNVNGEVVIDYNWRWLHDASGTNCYDGNKWTSACSSATDCASKCSLEGADYAATYGVTTSSNALSLKFVTQHAYGKNIGSRHYLMNSASAYEMFTLTGNELAFDMDADGGMAKYPTNKAGAKYGTGYCDAQCARDLKFVGGKANIEGWVPLSNDTNAGVGPYGAYCAEMDVWESNSHSFAVTPYACTNNAYHVCETSGCGGTYSADRFAGDCDANGCDFNPYRMGATGFYSKGKTVDTSKKFTVVTQFSNNKAFGDRDRFSEVGGFSKLNSALSGKWVLVMSLWDDYYANMLWLDSPGAARGDCPTTSGVPAEVENSLASATVTYSNIRFGPIGSTSA